MSLFFVDCESDGPCPGLGYLTEFGAVEFATKKFFHGRLWHTKPNEHNPAIPVRISQVGSPALVFKDFADWIKKVNDDSTRPTFISDNPAFDWQWINHGFHNYCGANPFGFSARRIGDYYAGMVKRFHAHNDWKKFRITKHDHNPVNDALGNVEAFGHILLTQWVDKQPES